MADKGYNVEVNLKGKDDLSKEVRKGKAAVDDLAESAHPKASRAFGVFSSVAVAGLNAIKSVLRTIRNAISGVIQYIRDMFDRIITGAKYAAVALAGLLTLVVKLGADSVETENLFSVSMGSMRSQAEQFVDQLSRAWRVNRYELMQFLGTMNVMLTSMGLGADEAYEMSKSLTKLAFDMASFYNMNPEEAFEKLQAGITGEAEPLKRLGILLNEATIEQYALNNAIWDGTGAMTEQQKVLARYGAILEQTNMAQGDMARTLESPQNRFRQIWALLKEIAQEIGQGISGTQIFGGVLGWIIGKLESIRDWVSAEGITATIDAWTERAKEFLGGLDWESLKEKAGMVWDFIKEKAGALWEYLSNVDWATKIDNALTYVNKKFDTLIAIITSDDPWKEFKHAIVYNVKEVFGDVITWAEDTFGKAYYYVENFVLGAITQFNELRHSMGLYKDEDIEKWKERFAKIKTEIGNFITEIEPFLEPIKKIGKAIWAWVEENPKLALTIGLVAAALIVLAPAIIAIIASVAGLVGGITVLVPLIAALGTTGGLIAAAIGLVIGALVSMALYWDDTCKLARAAWEGLTAFVSEKWEAVKWTFFETVDLMKDKWTEFKDWLFTGWEARWQEFMYGLMNPIDTLMGNTPYSNAAPQASGGGRTGQAATTITNNYNYNIPASQGAGGYDSARLLRDLRIAGMYEARSGA